MSKTSNIQELEVAEASSKISISGKRVTRSNNLGAEPQDVAPKSLNTTVTEDCGTSQSQRTSKKRKLDQISGFEEEGVCGDAPSKKKLKMNDGEVRLSPSRLSLSRFATVEQEPAREEPAGEVVPASNLIELIEALNTEEVPQSAACQEQEGPVFSQNQLPVCQEALAKEEASSSPEMIVNSMHELTIECQPDSVPAPAAFEEVVAPL